MKKIIILSTVFIFCLLSSTISLAQNGSLKSGFGINQDYHDFNVRLLDNKITSFDSSLSMSTRLYYAKYLNRLWEFNVGLSNGFLLNQSENNILVKKTYVFGMDVDILYKFNNGKLLPEDAPIAPYLSFGYNVNYLQAYKQAGLNPMTIGNEYGVGFKIGLGPKSKINVAVALDQQLNGDFDTHIQYRLGFAQGIGESSEPNKPENEIKDYDNDGIADVDDDCPTVAGIDAMGGCPENWAESGKVMDDSLLAQIETMEAELQTLKSDLENLKSTGQIIEIACTDEMVQRKFNNNSNVNAKDEVANTETNPDAGNVESNPGTTDEIESTRKEKDNISVSRAAPGNTNQSTPSSTSTSIASLYQKDMGLGFYVVAISTIDQDLAERAAQVLARDYPIVRILPQDNGFYRVGAYATRTKSEALSILDYAKSHGIPSGWLSFE
ncbi:MAG: hypothetical protein ACI8ZN_000682 [Bacteroidia bacterium]|jgi:hypothetical protein